MSESDIYKKYISYFQSVTTIGILTCGKSMEEAEDSAREKLRVSDLNYCHFEQTPLEYSDTEEWKPAFEIISENPTADGKAIEWSVVIGDEMKNAIANGLGVLPHELTKEHIDSFVRETLATMISKQG